MKPGLVQLKRSDIPKVRKELQEKQGNKCLICGLIFTSKRIPCLDHNHSTNMVRGVLCRACNSLEGKVWKYFVRMGARNQGIDYIKFLRGLIKFQKVKDTKYIYPVKAKRKKTK